MFISIFLIHKIVKNVQKCPKTSKRNTRYCCNGSKRIKLIEMFLNKSKNLSTSIKQNGLIRLKNKNFQECISLNEKNFPAQLMLDLKLKSPTIDKREILSKCDKNNVT